jgi:hypothetical protein
MERHVVLGAGNLGRAIFERLMTIPESEGRITAHLVSRSNGWRYPEDSVARIQELQPDVIWNCTGAGSIGGSASEQVSLHVGLVQDLMDGMPMTRQVHFSSDYAVNPVSFYAMTKKWAEDAVKAHRSENAYIIRVANLHGPHKRGGIIDKLAAAAKTGKVKAVGNYVLPTWTPWLAETLVASQEALFKSGHKCFNLAGPYAIPVHHIARLFQEHGVVQVEEIGFDLTRPATPAIGQDGIFKLAQGHPTIAEMVQDYWTLN